MNQINFHTLNILKAGIGIFGAFLTLIAISSAANAANLTVNISEVEDDNGYVIVALYQGESDYTSGKMAMSKRVKAKAGDNQAVFNDVAPGDYAIKMFHDANDNKKLDFNLLGMPKEGYGFSNNAGRFGEPAYKEAQFIVEEDTAIQIVMN